MQTGTSDRSTPTIRVHCECVGAYGAQLDMCAYATLESGAVVGRLQYSIYYDTIHVAMVEVVEKMRRKGVATALYEAALAEHPESLLAHSLMTDAGVEFRRAFDRAHHDRLVPLPPERPSGFGPEDYERVTNALMRARSSGDAPQEDAMMDMLNRMSDYDNAVSALPWDLVGVDLPEKPDIIIPPTAITTPKQPGARRAGAAVRPYSRSGVRR